MAEDRKIPKRQLSLGFRTAIGNQFTFKLGHVIKSFVYGLIDKDPRVARNNPDASDFVLRLPMLVG